MKRIAFFVIALFLLLSFFSCEEYLEEGQAKDVTTEKQDTLKESQAQLFFSWGQDYLQAKNYERALLNFQKAAKESTDYVDAYIYMGKTYEAQSNYISADSVYKALKKKYPQSSAVNRARAKMLINLGKDDEAYKEYQEAVQKNPKDGLAWAGLGYLEKLKGNINKAKEYYEKAYENNPDNLTICFTLGEIYVKTNEPAKAVTLLEKVVQDHPRSVDARKKLAQAYINSKQYDKAIEQMEELIKLVPAAENKYLLIEGSCYEMAKNYTKAEEIYKKVIEKYPENIDAYIALGQMYLNMKKYSKARLYANKALKIKPNNADAYYLIATTYLMQSKFDSAIKYYKKVLKYGDATLKKNARIAIKKAEKAKEDAEWNASWGE